MSDPKDKLVLFKEILSLMVVFIGFMTALTTSGVIKNIKVEPVTLIVIIALGLFFVQFLVRVVLGEEKYNEIKSKALATARDFAIVVLVIIGFYFAGKYAAGYNAPAGAPDSAKIESAEETGQLSSSPLKNLKKEKSQQQAKAKEKPPARKGDEKPQKTDEKASRTAEKPSKHEGKTSKTEEKTAKGDEKPSKTEEKMNVVEEKPVKTEEKTVNAEEKSIKNEHKNIKAEETVETSVAAEIKTGHTGELSIVRPAEADGTLELAVQAPPKAHKTPETSEKPPVKNDATAETAVHAAADTVPVQPRSAEPVVINVIAEEPPAPAEKKTPPESAAAPPQAPKAVSDGESSEVITYKMTKSGDEDDNTEDISEAGTKVKFEQTSAELRDKVNNDKVMIKKEYEINKTPSGIKNAGEKVIEGGKKIFDGGANLLEKAGQGIKKQINKVIK